MNRRRQKPARQPRSTRKPVRGRQVNELVSVIWWYPLVREAIELFVRTICRPIESDEAEIQQFREMAVSHFLHCMDVIPEKVALPKTSKALRLKNPFVPGEVLSSWHLESGFVDQHGKPLALPAKGKGRSFTSLVRKVAPDEDPGEVLKYLEKIGAVARMGKLYRPLGRVARHRHSAAFQVVHQFYALIKTLRTLEGNALLKKYLRGYQFTTDGTVPKRLRKTFRKVVSGYLDHALMSIDDEMFRVSAAAKRGEPTEAVTIGAFFSDGRRVRSLIQDTQSARGLRPRLGRVGPGALKQSESAKKAKSLTST